VMGRIIHFCFDGNFIDGSIAQFRKYYPDQNIFFIYQPSGHIGNRKVKANGPDIFWLNTSDADACSKFVSESLRDYIDIESVVLHGLADAYIEALRMIKSQYSVKVYWLFWGFELYNALGEEGKMNLIDQISPFSISSYIGPTKYSMLLRRFMNISSYHKRLLSYLPLINYFCFWNYEEFLLLKKYYPNDIQYRYFQYNTKNKDSIQKKEFCFYEKKPYSILINHQASVTGNHITVFNKLKSIDKDNLFDKVVPLSYGNYRIKKIVLKSGKRLFHDKFKPILDYMGLESYEGFLRQVGVAVFGQLRQEAAGNIIYLLENGTKVFLRTGNPLLPYYRKKGYIIFTLEDDLKSMDDLKPLSLDEMKHNWQVRQETRTYPEDYMPQLIDK